MSLLSIIAGTDNDEGAAILVGVSPPTAIIGSSDPNVPLLLRCAQQEGKELARRHDWQALKVEYTVPTIAAELQTALPADYERLLPMGEVWNRTLGMKYAGPTDDTTWGRVKALGFSVGSPGWWRLIGNAMQITPAPTAGQTLAFPYMSKSWVRPAIAGTNKDHFTLDTDTTIIPERLITLGIVWRWNKRRGFDYAEDMATYEREVERACSRDRAQGVIVIGKSPPADNGSSWPGTIHV